MPPKWCRSIRWSANSACTMPASSIRVLVMPALAARARARCWKYARAKCRSSSSTARSSAAWFTRKCWRGPPNSTAAASARTTRRRVSNCQSTFASERCAPVSHQCVGARRRESDGEDSNPDDARAVAIVRVRYDAAERGIAEERQHQRRGEASEVGEFGAVDAKQQQDRQQRHRRPGHRHIDHVDRGKADLAVLLPRCPHRRHDRRRVALDDAVSMQQRGADALTGSDRNQLPRGGAQRGVDLHGGIIAQAAEYDGAHLVAEAGEAAELVEHALAPKKRVGVERQFIAVRA